MTTRSRKIKGIRWPSLLLATALAGCSGSEEDLDVPPEAEVYDERGGGGGGGKADGTADTRAYDPLPAGVDLTRPLQVLFTPDEPAVTLELAMIDRVISARKAAGGSFAEGQNPYRIRYAVYNLRNMPIVSRLADAEAAGVDVQILIDYDQLDPARTWNTTDEYLAGRGFEVVRDARTLNDTSRRTADLIGVKTAGLMHLKTRLYETPAERSLLTGSFNPGDESVYNEETFHLIREARLLDRYAAAYDRVMRGQPHPNTWDEGQAVNVLFTPEASGPRGGAQILSWLKSEREQILLSVFALRDIGDAAGNTLVGVLGAKVKEGVPVWVLTDRKQSDGVEATGERTQPDDKTEDRLRAAGVHVYEIMNTQTLYTAMHHKVAILGRTQIRVITDAANWTQAALGSSTKSAQNVESILFIDTNKLDGGRTGRRYLSQWFRVLDRWAAQSQPFGEPAAAAVAADLMARAGWPQQTLSFVVDQARTELGEEVRAVGDHARLGAWETGGLGLPLLTTAGEYPTWRSASVRLPVGAGFFYKYAVGRAGNKVHRWEGGGNRLGRSGPPVLGGDDAVIRGVWQ